MALVAKNIISRPKLKYTMDIMLKSRMGIPTYLSRNEEAFFVSATEMKGAHTLLTTRKNLVVKLSSVVEGLGGREINQ